MKDEYEVLDTIFEALPDTLDLSLYPINPNITRPEMYIKLDGECWRIKAERHYHQEPDPEPDEEES